MDRSEVVAASPRDSGGSRSRDQSGFSGWALAGVVLQVVLTVVALLIAGLLMDSSGWFDSVHDRALVWGDLVAFTGFVWGLPLIVNVLTRRVKVGRVQAALAAVVAVVIAGMHSMIHR